MIDPQELGLEVRGKSGDEYKVLCPFHGDTHASASFNASKGLFYCYACGAKGSATEIAALTGGYVSDKGEAGETLSGFELDWCHLGRSPLALDNPYLKLRRVTNEQVERFQIREHVDGISFEVLNATGDVTGYQVRHYERSPKYQFYGKKQLLWPFDAIREPRTLLAVEGIFGVLRLDLVGHHAVSIFGTGNAVKAAKVLKSKDAYALFDTDDAGLIAAGKFMLEGIPAILIPKHWEAPDEINPKQMKKLMSYVTLNVGHAIRRADNPKHVASQIYRSKK